MFIKPAAAAEPAENQKQFPRDVNYFNVNCGEKKEEAAAAPPIIIIITYKNSVSLHRHKLFSRANNRYPLSLSALYLEIVSLIKPRNILFASPRARAHKNIKASRYIFSEAINISWGGPPAKKASSAGFLRRANRKSNLLNRLWHLDLLMLYIYKPPR